ncbi:MAG: hypothetical protein IH600_13250 [Bacteroidetes bacterium]|nr:hypothetical protein [Bacteroidota bacterium]
MIIDSFRHALFFPRSNHRTVHSSLIVVLFLIVRFCGAAQVQPPSEELRCGMRSSTEASFLKGIEIHGGAYLPTQGAIRGLVVFVQTLNDSAPDDGWPLGSLPSWRSDYVDRVQRYFSDMSGSTMQLQLDIYPDLMITRGTEDGYVYWEQNFGSSIREILDSLDTQLDFADYDRWDADGKSYRLQQGPDGKVDLLIFIFRSIANSTFLPFSGVSDLGFAGYHFLDGSLARWVYGGSGQYNDASASGLTICRSPGHRMVIEQEFAFQVTIHEFGHKLFGEGHPAELFGSLGVMANAGNGYAMNSFERQLAGYIDFQVTEPGVDTVVMLRDYVTTGDAVLIPLPALDRSYYSLEYRAKLSEWDTAPLQGLYAFRIYDSWSKSQKEVHVVSSEGKFDWALDSTNSVYPVRPAPLSGYNRYQRIPINGKNYWAEGWWGDPRSAFTMERPEFAVLKNPTPDFLFGLDTIRTNLHITLLSAGDSSAVVRISYTAPSILSAEAVLQPQLTLSPPYPHPLRERGNGIVPFSVGREGHVRISLHDALGRRVRTVFDDQVAAGAQQFMLTTEGLSAGIYQLVLESAEGRSMQSIVITR